VSDTAVVDLDTTGPGLTFVDTDGRQQEIRCGFLVGADGSHSMCRKPNPEAARREYSKVYPFAWFGIICSAPRAHPKLIYNHSERGFALISQRTESMQRMYFQCDPDEDVQVWSEDRIWTELQARLGANGHVLKEGPITEKTVLRFRSFVHEPMQYGRLLLAGDAAHTVPPTGAKGLNLALADVRVLADALERARPQQLDGPLRDYTKVALARVWKAQHFSYWMTMMLHRLPDESEFDVQRQRAELASVVGSRAASTFLAERLHRLADVKSGERRTGR
jgi:p-hydroxybenzoate 3-monooxygenase